VSVNGELLVQLALGALGVGLTSLPILLWLHGRRRHANAMALPAGLTDDLRLDLPAGVTHEKLALFVIENALRCVPDGETERQLVREFSLSPDDAAHVRDRVFGGVFRAALALAGNRHNDPDREKDALARAGFARVMSEPTIAARIYPQFAAARAAK
jgi:hypothetical protein